MSVHKTPDGRWFVRYTKGRNRHDPGRTREYFGRGPEGEAKARQRNRDLGLGKQRNQASPLFAELVNAYLAAKLPAMAEASQTAINAKMSGIILPRLGHKKALSITPELLDRYVTNRRQSVKLTTIHRELSDIRAVLRWSVKRRYLPTNPMEGFTLPKRDDAIIMPPSTEEIKLIIKHASPTVYRAIMIAYYTGLRPGKAELLTMQWDQIDTTAKIIMVVSAQKNGLKKRVIPITDNDFLKILTDWKTKDLEAGIPFVIHHNGKKINSVRTAWETAKKKAGITRRLPMYSLRHAFATKLLDNGADLKHVSSLLGHKSVQQTVDTYQHLSTRLSRDTVNKLPTIFED